MIKKTGGIFLLAVMLCCLSACGKVIPSSADSSDSNSQTEKNTDNKNSQNKTDLIVVYFSCTNTTRSVAELAAELLDASLYEIVPSEPYTDHDLDYGSHSSRTEQEQNDPESRPTIGSETINMEQYDTVILAYPIWWGQAPKIISTFLESYDFSNKTLIPLCTSSSSPIGSSASNLHSLTSDTATWKEGVRFAGNASKEEIKEWLDRNGLTSKE